MMFNIGQEAREFSDYTDQQVIDSALKVLHNIYGNFKDPINYLRSNWLKDENTFQSFTYFAKGATKADQKNLCMNINGKLFFAGEHCSPYIGTIHGAFMSGN